MSLNRQFTNYKHCSRLPFPLIILKEFNSASLLNYRIQYLEYHLIIYI